MTHDRALIEKSVSEFLGLLESPHPMALQTFLSQIQPEIRDAVEESCRLAISIHSVFSSHPPGHSESGVGGKLGPFTLKRFLGEGGMGRVYLARQETLGRDVAVKVIRGDRARRSEFRRRFDRESRVIASLDHPGIVKIIDRGEDDQQIYFVMEFVEGPSLREAIRERRDREPKTEDPTGALLPSTHPSVHLRAARLAAEVASAVAHAHGRGISHRDLKPENIQIGAGGRPRIIDFGLASESITASSTHGEGFVGTAAYLPPTGKRPASGVERDLWAMGVLLYEVVTLRRPFDGDTVPEVSAEIQRGRFAPASAVCPSVPRDLDRVIRKALAPDPNDRYRTAAEFEQDLGRFLAGIPVLAGAASPIATVRRHLRRHRRAYGALAVLGAVAVGGFCLARHFHKRGLEDELLRSATRSTCPSSSDARLAELAHRRERVDLLLSREDLSSLMREKADSARREILSEVEAVYDASIARIERARGSRPGVPLDEYRPPSEPDLFQALAIAAQAKNIAIGAISRDPFASVFPVLTIHADCARSHDAVVQVCPINLLTGMTEPAVITTSLPVYRIPVPPGLSVVVVEVPGLGRAEYVRDFARAASIEIHPKIVGDDIVRSRIAMVEVPAGTYRVGQLSASAENIYREREVTVRGFLIDVYETTCDEYLEFLEANPHERRPPEWGSELEKYDHAWDARPVQGVSWMVAQRYAEWRGKRLPTWIEWQIAVRGREAFLYPWGNDVDVDRLSAMASVGVPAPSLPPRVGSSARDRSPFGVVDGFGSVREWTCLPYLTNAERVIYANSGWRMTVSNAYTRSRWDPRSVAAGVTSVTEAAPESETIGIRCIRSVH